MKLEPELGYLLRSLLRKAIVVACLGVLAVWSAGPRPAQADDDPPRPLLAKGHPVDWWVVFKFGASAPFAGCGPDTGKRACPFGGAVRTDQSFGQQFAVASSQDARLKKGSGCLGATTIDPVGATFGPAYNGSYFYVVWNDQFYRDPALKACGKSDSCGGPWGHSKGMLAWNSAGEGFVMQVTTPSWPGSGSKTIPRKAGNTLGCVRSNNSLKASQHFFALKLTRGDLEKVLAALANTSIVTDPTVPQIVRNGGPEKIRTLVDALGRKSSSTQHSVDTLSTGVVLISKPSLLKVPPWQMMSALLGRADGRAATWWTKPWIYTTTKASKVKCWNGQLGDPGPVAIALSGQWDGKPIGLAAPKNHAKIGIARAGDKHFAVFSDLNQQGALAPPDCSKSQNGRGGLFFVLQNKELFDSIADLVEGETASTRPK